MPLDGSHRWLCDLSVRRATGSALFPYTTLFRSDPGYGPIGVAWDGSHLWVSEYVGGTPDPGGRIMRFGSDGAPTGVELLANDVCVGGLEYDSTDDTLYVGTFDRVYHNSLSVTPL